MDADPKLYGCVIHQYLPGHIKVGTRSSFLTADTHTILGRFFPLVKPDPGDPSQHDRFIRYNDNVYYVAMNHRVYETNIEPGKTVEFMNGVAYMLVNSHQTVRVTMRKLHKLEWMFL